MNSVATNTAVQAGPKGPLITDWRPEDPQFWVSYKF